MSDIRNLKRKMKTVTGIGQITKAMKMVASVKIRKAERNMKAALPYSQAFKESVEELAGSAPDFTHPLLEVREAKNSLIILITSDKGLCGSYNSALFRKLQNLTAENEEKQYKYLVLGNKGVHYLKRRNLPAEKSYPLWEPTWELAQELAAYVREQYQELKLDEIIALYNYPQSMMVQKETVFTVLPLNIGKVRAQLNLLAEPEAEISLAYLLPRYLEVLIYQILLEARNAELGARLRAMTNATDNAEDFLASLRLKYFRARQEAITNEILEITSSAEALRSS